MHRKVAGLILKLGGWKTEGQIPLEDKVLVTAAPHTSKMDFFWASVYYASLGGKFNFLIRHEFDFWPMNFILKRMGGITIPNSKNVNFIKLRIDVYNSMDKVHMAIAPEGTTERNPVWSAAFHAVAKTADISVYMAYLDYKNRIVGISPEKMNTCESANECVRKLYEFYDGIQGKYPDKFAVGNYK